jgi:hypothetical protein
LQYPMFGQAGSIQHQSQWHERREEQRCECRRRLRRRVREAASDASRRAETECGQRTCLLRPVGGQSPRRHWYRWHKRDALRPYMPTTRRLPAHGRDQRRQLRAGPTSQSRRIGAHADFVGKLQSELIKAIHCRRQGRLTEQGSLRDAP